MENTNNNAAQLPVRINYVTGNFPTYKDYQLMVVACDPRNLDKVCDYSPKERALFGELINFNFHTTLLRVKLKQKQEHGVIFAPATLNKMQGFVYGFRNESAKRFGLAVSNTMEENLITVYQLQGSQSPPLTPEEFAAILKVSLPRLDWWPFGTDYTILDSLTTPYFDQYPVENLKAALPWKLMDGQGQNQTLYVHASTCFESVLDCWGYENILLNLPHVQRAMPASKSAPIAIIGAGVSGLLFAVKLKRLGYTNIDILESTERYGGKTHTIIKDGPYPPGNNQPTYCELGTCYMSPAYDDLVEDLKQYLVGNTRITFGQEDKFRAIVTTGELPASYNAPLVMAYDDYVVSKAAAELGWGPDFSPGVIKAEVGAELIKYLGLHEYYFGNSFPMPITPPSTFLNEHSSRSFYDFLVYHNMQCLAGILQYGYEVQGYGSLKSIPAYYGLVWITPPIIKAILEDAVWAKIPIVTAWSKGWGDLWAQIVAKEKLNILYKINILSIQRNR